MRFPKRVLTVLIVSFVIVAGLFAQSITEVKHGAYEGRTIILHTNDVHGAVDGYSKLVTLRDSFIEEGAEVILIDNGDYSQGTRYVGISEGESAVLIMNEVGYDYAGVGNHEFDYGYMKLLDNLDQAEFTVLCSNILGKHGDLLFDDYAIYTTEGGARIGLFGIDTPETRTKTNPVNVSGLTITDGQKMYDQAQAVVDLLEGQGVETIICIGHLGTNSSSEPNRSTDLYANVDGIDFLIDGHSHSVFSGLDGYAMQQTGTGFAYIGVIVLDSATADILDYYLVDCTEIEPDAELQAKIDAMKSEVDSIYGYKFAESEVFLNGNRDPGNRTGETNLGDLITDAMLWRILQDPSEIKVPIENIIAITNGGGIRASIQAGDITKGDVNTVLPFGNTLTVAYITGETLLKVLEASTCVAPVALGAFPQVSGIEFTIDSTKTFDKADATYPESTYYGPASIQRVSINSINGKAWDPEALYAVVTNNFCTEGGDTYYELKMADQYDTGLSLDDVVVQYITEVLGGVVGKQYAEPQGRITILTQETSLSSVFQVLNLEPNLFSTKYGNMYCTASAQVFKEDLGFDWGIL